MLPTNHYVYQSHGVTLLSPFPIAELNSSHLPLTPDNTVEISYTTDPQGFPYPHLEYSGYLITAETAILCVPREIVFFIEKGRSIQILTHANVEMDLLRTYLVGNVLALLLTQRGYLVLHACSIEIFGKAIAVMGSSGAGKSSLAAALVQAGHQLCNDDLSPLLLKDNQPFLWPGYPQIKLYQEVIQTLRLTQDRLSSLHQREEKWGYRNHHDLCSTPLPLRCIYMLEPGEHIEIEDPLSTIAAIDGILQQSWPNRLGTSGGERHLRQCVKLAQDVPCFRLIRGTEVSSLPQLAEKILDHQKHLITLGL